ncbi:IS607 family transposase [Rhizophagus clarus]|uniref:IS607 family transposase n=1 Tax=Rhizophagus clarus TaxID=94130 RepID=A0A8H3QGG8_9GLOM|nr:IS607 family transposase [Rhizophagus clarus]
MTSQSKHCDDGPTPEELLLSRSAMPESVQSINEVTSNDRLQISNSTTQNMKSSATLAQGSTGNDRLCHFGSELVEWIFEKNGTQFVVLSTDVSAESNEAGELAEDLLAIVTGFVTWHNGLRSAANRRKRRDVAQEIKDIQEGSEETSSRQGTTDSYLSQPAGASETQKMDGNSMMDMQSVSYCSRKRRYQMKKEGFTRTMSQRKKFQ